MQENANVAMHSTHAPRASASAAAVSSLPPQNTEPLEYTPIIGKDSLSDQFGKWAYAHKDEMNSAPARYGLRNGVNAAGALAALTAVIVPVRHGFAKAAESASKGTFTGFEKLDKVISKACSEKSSMVPMMVGVGLSFSTFRTLFKVGKRNYDRLFSDESAENSAKAFHDMPRNIMKDIEDIAPTEFAATSLAAIPLVAIRSGFGGMKESIKHDIMGSIPAYVVFFELTERLYSGFGKDQSALQGIFQEASPTPKPADDKDRLPYASFTEDSPVRLAFRKLPAVALGIAPYIYLNRKMYARNAMKELGNELAETMKTEKKAFAEQLGGMKAGGESFATSYGKEITPYLMFPAYTVISEAWMNNYDKLFSSLQEKYTKESQKGM